MDFKFRLIRPRYLVLRVIVFCYVLIFVLANKSASKQLNASEQSSDDKLTSLDNPQNSSPNELEVASNQANNDGLLNCGNLIDFESAVSDQSNSEHWVSVDVAVSDQSNSGYWYDCGDWFDSGCLINAKPVASDQNSSENLASVEPVVSEEDNIWNLVDISQLTNELANSNNPEREDVCGKLLWSADILWSYAKKHVTRFERVDNDEQVAQQSSSGTSESDDSAVQLAKAHAATTIKIESMLQLDKAIDAIEQQIQELPKTYQWYTNSLESDYNKVVDIIGNIKKEIHLLVEQEKNIDSVFQTKLEAITQLEDIDNWFGGWFSLIQKPAYNRQSAYFIQTLKKISVAIKPLFNTLCDHINPNYLNATDIGLLKILLSAHIKNNDSLMDKFWPRIEEYMDHTKTNQEIHTSISTMAQHLSTFYDHICKEKHESIPSQVVSYPIDWSSLNWTRVIEVQDVIGAPKSLTEWTEFYADVTSQLCQMLKSSTSKITPKDKNQSIDDISKYTHEVNVTLESMTKIFVDVVDRLNQIRYQPNDSIDLFLHQNEPIIMDQQTHILGELPISNDGLKKAWLNADLEVIMFEMFESLLDKFIPYPDSIENAIANSFIGVVERYYNFEDADATLAQITRLVQQAMAKYILRLADRYNYIRLLFQRAKEIQSLQMCWKQQTSKNNVSKMPKDMEEIQSDHQNINSINAEIDPYHKMLCLSENWVEQVRKYLSLPPFNHIFDDLIDQNLSQLVIFIGQVSEYKNKSDLTSFLNKVTAGQSSPAFAQLKIIELVCLVNRRFNIGIFGLCNGFRVQEKIEEVVAEINQDTAKLFDDQKAALAKTSDLLNTLTQSLRRLFNQFLDPTEVERLFLQAPYKYQDTKGTIIEYLAPRWSTLPLLPLNSKTAQSSEENSNPANVTVCNSKSTASSNPEQKPNINPIPSYERYTVNTSSSKHKSSHPLSYNGIIPIVITQSKQTPVVPSPSKPPYASHSTSFNLSSQTNPPRHSVWKNSGHNGHGSANNTQSIPSPTIPVPTFSKEESAQDTSPPKAAQPTTTSHSNSQKSSGNIKLAALLTGGGLSVLGLIFAVGKLIHSRV
ncbi:hypothetical protein NEHOM01_1345 [Nematocida homosporus]|uniref:uncharacterized protein n=1 Tax=Nematocida homosporus TaxID=1912981 RepID=UPI00221F2988|nr:uncharacterized protein NEHOM01_1345 [Nematocida homosporus]KAI5186256.1 hypothetical protein NEHOM01_1345 [Nematocida homosporus]